jgi:CHAD domain-containing protein
MKSGVGMRKHAHEQARLLLRRFAYQVNRTSRSAGTDEIHDLRVSIRRFSQCLRVFAQFFPSARRKRVRKRLRNVMGLAAEVRNCDVALELMREAGIEEGAATARTLARKREDAIGLLYGTLKRWARRDFSRRWRAQLEL